DFYMITIEYLVFMHYLCIFITIINCKLIMSNIISFRLYIFGTSLFALIFGACRYSNAKYSTEYLYDKMPNKDDFFSRSDFFDKLAGKDELREQIVAGKSETEIRASWKDLEDYNSMRNNYLLYQD